MSPSAASLPSSLRRALRSLEGRCRALPLLPALLISGLALPAGPLAPHDAAGAIVCQHQKKSRRVRLEAGPECRRKKWNKVADLGALAGDLGGVIGTVDSLGASVSKLDATCPQDSVRAFYEPAVAGNPSQTTDGCRQLDGNQTECDGAFQLSQGRPTACWYYKGTCRPCDVYDQASLACTNTCEPPTCPGAPSRMYAGGPDFRLTTFSGAPKRFTCARFQSQSQCESYYEMASPAGVEIPNALGGSNPGVLNRTLFLPTYRLAVSGAFDWRPQSCAWDGAMGGCYSCDLVREAQGKCTNACLPVPTCDALAFTDFCERNSSQQSCTGKYEVSPSGDPTSCHWDAAANQCVGCTLPYEFALGVCSNTCM